MSVVSGFARLPARRNRVLILARDPAVLSVAENAVRSERRGPPAIARSGREALAHLAAPGDALPHLVCDVAAVGPQWTQVLADLSDPRGTTEVVLVSADDGPSESDLSVVRDLPGTGVGIWWTDPAGVVQGLVEVDD